MSNPKDEIPKELLLAELERRHLQEEAQVLQTDLRAFGREAWKVIKPGEPMKWNWHIDAIDEHLEAVTAGEIRKLQVWLPRGMMKPVDADAFVLMGDGSRKLLRDVEVDDLVIGHSGQPRRVLAVHDQGLLPTLNITTYAGREVAAAAGHPFLTPYGWKRADELVPGIDTLATIIAPQFFSLNGHSHTEMRLLGYFIGDGNVTYGKSRESTVLAANITCFDDEQTEDIVFCANSMGFQANYAKGAARRVNISGGVRPWLQKIGLAGQSSHTKRVPAHVLTSDREAIGHFLGAYFACDGSIGYQNNPRGSASMIFYSVNRDLLADVQHLLLRLGIGSRIREHLARNNNFTGGEHRSWRLYIGGIDDTSRFMEQIPVIGAKARRLEAIARRRTRFPETLGGDEVISVEDGGVRECRCLTVAGDESFTANDLVVKNSLNVSVFWPAWEWTTKAWLRYWTAVYELGLSGRLAAMSRSIIASEWYRERWPHVILTRDGERYFANDQGGTRLATAPKGTALGEHGHRIIIDDPINALAADATSRVTLDSTNEWYDASVQGSKADPATAAEVIIMQRLHANDLAAHAYEQDPSAWTILCLPERYEADHPHCFIGDPRKEGELLWPDYRGPAESDAMAKTLGPYRRSGQMQQRPSAKEGELLKRYWWRFYHPDLFTDPKMADRRPKFSMVVQSIDTPLKDKQANDMVAIQAWGVKGADRYLLDLKKGHMSKGQAYRAIVEQANHVRKQHRTAQHHVLIENAGYGVELYEELRRVLTGVHKLNRAHEGDKELRAEAAAASLESGNCYLPGFRRGNDEMSLPRDDLNSAEITDYLDSCSSFPNGRYDDDVDAWSQAMNWLSSRIVRPARVYSSFAA